MTTTVANDAFGRLRVGLPETLHDSRLTYDLAPLLWETTLAAALLRLAWEHLMRRLWTA